MEKNGNDPGYKPTAPYDNYPPPPSYEESQRMVANIASPYQSASSMMSQVPPPSVMPYGSAPPPSMMPYGSAPPPSMMPYGSAPPPSYHNNPQVLMLAKGAELRTTASGSISIPPPPPGCLPTSAQLAAMQGAPVIVKKQKNKFF